MFNITKEKIGVISMIELVIISIISMFLFYIHLRKVIENYDEINLVLLAINALRSFNVSSVFCIK